MSSGTPHGLERSTAASERVASDTVPEPARGPARLLLDPVFGPFFAGKLLSTMGIWIHNIAAAIVVFQLTRSATLVGAVSIAQFAPQFLLTPLSGAHADRGDRRRQLVAGRLVAASGSGGLAVYILVVGLEGTAGAAAVIVAAFVVGIGFSIGGPAMQALIPSLVRRAELPSAVALNSVPFTIARASGPALGAVLVTAAHPAAAFAIAAASNLLFAIVIVAVRIREVARTRPRDTSVRGGLRHVRADSVLLALLAGAATVGIGTDPVITLTPSLADELGAGERLVGALASSFGVGAAIGFVVLGRARRVLGLPRLGTTGLLLLAAGFAALAWSGTAWVALSCLVVAGAGNDLLADGAHHAHPAARPRGAAGTGHGAVVGGLPGHPSAGGGRQRRRRRRDLGAGGTARGRAGRAGRRLVRPAGTCALGGVNAARGTPRDDTRLSATAGGRLDSAPTGRPP
ncbi:MFS transporter [Egicoccus sp. AB-alg2]|uniref:MFS transporter n=1 Tax=Egicoccus sp. AB-alg2 TaxID=3242693 RepID=UPI00359E14EE